MPAGQAGMLEMFSDVGDGLKRVKNYKVWQDGNHPELLFSNEFLQQKLDYVHMNPVAEFVDEPEYYWYSSAKDYYTKQKGLWTLGASRKCSGHCYPKQRF